MDKNIFLRNVSSYDGIGYFCEYEDNVLTGKREIKRFINIPMCNFNGAEYECENFNVSKNGKCIFKGTHYESIDDLMHGISSKSRQIAKASMNEDIKVFADSIDLMLNGATIPDGVRVVKSSSDDTIYSIENENDITIVISDKVRSANTDAFTLSNKQVLFDKNKKYGIVKLIGGGPALAIIGNIIEGITAEQFDASELYCREVESIGDMFKDCNFDVLDLSWTKRCKKLKWVAGLFKRYRGKEIDLRQFNDEHLYDVRAMFCATRAKIVGIENLNMRYVTVADQMFEEYEREYSTLDLSKWDTRRLQSATEMFSKCQIGKLNVRGWNTSALKIARCMFRLFRGVIYGIDNKDDGWQLPSVINMASMFEHCNTDDSIIKLKTTFKNVKSLEDIFYNARMDTLDLSDMVDVNKNIFKEGTTDMVLLLKVSVVVISKREKLSKLTDDLLHNKWAAHLVGLYEEI